MPAKVLIVENEAIVAENMRDILGRMGYAISGSVNCGEAALEAVERERPDLVLMDIDLDQKHEGMAPAETIRTRHGVPVIYVMAADSEATMTRAGIAHPFGFLTKPFAADNLRFAIEATLHNHILELRLRQAEQALRESERRQRAILDKIPDPVWLKDRDGRFIAVNRVWCETFGLDEQHAIGKTALKLLPLAIARKFHGDDPAILASGKPVQIEEQITDGQGGTLWFDICKAPLRNEREEIVGIVGVARDVTRWKQAESALAQKTETYRALLCATLDGVFESDEHDRITDANQAFCRLLGYSRAELATMHIADVEAIETPEMVAQHSLRLKREGGGRFETRHRAKDGRLIDIEISVTYVPSSHRFVAFCHDITKRKHAEAVLRKAEETLRMEQALLNHLISTIPDHIYFKDRQSRFICVNNAMAKWLGMRSPEEAVGKTDFDVFSEEHARQAYEDEQHIMSTGKQLIGLVEKETWPDGRVTWMSTTKVPLRHADGTITGLVGISRDITERKQDEERIRRLNRTLAVLSDINHAIVRNRDLLTLHRETCRIVVKTGDFRMAWIGLLDTATARLNSVAYSGDVGDYIEKLNVDLRGCVPSAGPAGEALYRGEHAICNDIERDSHMEPWREAALHMGYRSFGAFPLKIGGRTIGAINLYSDEPGFFDDEELAMLDELAMDLSFALDHANAESERRKAEEQARHLAAFPELNPNPVLEFAADGTLAYANPAAQALATGSGVADLSTLLPPGIRQIVAECLALGQPRLRLETQDGARTISWSFYPIASQCTVHCYAGDITERLQLEERFRQAQKMEAIGQLAGGVAHDFNNLLTVMQGHCGLLLGSASTADPEVAESAKEIQAAAIRAASLTRQLLTFSRRLPMKAGPIDLDAVVLNVDRMLQRLIGEDIVLHTRLLPGGAWVEGDSAMIEQVVINLAVNARDAIHGGGELWLGVDGVTIDETAVRRPPRARPGSFVCLSLRDTGQGIQPNDLPHIFEPFFTTKEVGKGTGLGLATVLGIVEQHHGWIEVESNPGEGTTFRVYLPRLPEGGVPPGGPRDASQTLDGNESILVVEDDPAVRALAIKILGARGYRVKEASSGAAALESCRQQPAAFDLLLTDLIMPGGVSGAQLAEQLRSKQPGLRVIFMSGYSRDMAGVGAGASFLQKPFDPAHLAIAVRTCLDTM